MQHSNGNKRVKQDNMTKTLICSYCGQEVKREKVFHKVECYECYLERKRRTAYERYTRIKKNKPLD